MMTTATIMIVCEIENGPECVSGLLVVDSWKLQKMMTCARYLRHRNRTGPEWRVLSQWFEAVVPLVLHSISVKIARAVFSTSVFLRLHTHVRRMILFLHRALPKIIGECRVDWPDR